MRLEQSGTIYFSSYRRDKDSQIKLSALRDRSLLFMQGTAHKTVKIKYNVLLNLDELYDGSLWLLALGTCFFELDYVPA